MKNYLKKNYNYIIVFLVPWILILIHSIVRTSWLTGQGSLLNGDTGIQLYPLMVEFWEKVHSGDSLFYSWNAGNGIDFYLNTIYYLISPFNIIILLLPKACIEDAIQFVMVLKWSLAGLTMTYYFMHTRYNTIEKHKSLVSGVLGIAFVLSNSMLTLLGYFNWLDVIIIFPLLLLALETMLNEGKWKLYYVLLTIAMLCNFYMAYQVCIFLVFWFFIHLNKDIDKKLPKFLLFAGSSVLSAVTSMVVLLPAALGATNRYHSGAIMVWLNNIYSVGEKLFLFSDGLVEWGSYQPNLYFSTGFFVLFILFFIVKLNKIDKLKLGITWLFVFASLFSGVLSVFWHGFSVPYGVNHRFLYILIFLMLYMAMETIINLHTVPKRGVLLFALLEIVYMVVCFLHITKYNDFYGYFITFLLLALYNILLYFYLKSSIKYGNFLITISVFLVLELGANAYYELKEYNIKNWNDTMCNREAAVLSESVSLDAGQRADFSDSTNNMGLVLNLPSTNQFVSYNSNAMIELYKSLGMEFSETSSCLLSGTSPLINLMFNIRYGISNWEGDFSDIEYIKKAGELNLYRINRLAGLGYMVDSDITQWEVEDLSDFDLQNDFLYKATGIDDMFEPVLPKENFTDGMLSYRYDESNYEKGYFYYDYVSKNIASNEMTEFSFTAEEDMDLYLEAFSQRGMINYIFIDGKQVCEDNIIRFQTCYHIGNVKKGQKISIYSMHKMGVGESAALWFRLAKFNEENYAKAYDKMSKNVYQIEEMNSSYVSGMIQADKDGIMMTSIPAMDGFTVYVDGKQTEFDAIGDALIGIPLSKGEHRIEFKYRTPYFIEGLIGSFVGIFLFLVLCVVDKRRGRRAVNEVEEMEA